LSVILGVWQLWINILQLFLMLVQSAATILLDHRHLLSNMRLVFLLKISLVKHNCLNLTSCGSFVIIIITSLNSEHLLTCRRIGTQVWDIVIVIVFIVLVLRFEYLAIRVSFKTWWRHCYLHLVKCLRVVAVLPTGISFSNAHGVWVDIQGLLLNLLLRQWCQNYSWWVSVNSSLVVCVIAELELLLSRHIHVLVLYIVCYRVHLLASGLVLSTMIHICIIVLTLMGRVLLLNSGDIWKLWIVIGNEHFRAFTFVKHLGWLLLSLHVLLIFALIKV